MRVELESKCDDRKKTETQKHKSSPVPTPPPPNTTLLLLHCFTCNYSKCYLNSKCSVPTMGARSLRPKGVNQGRLLHRTPLMVDHRAPSHNHTGHHPWFLRDPYEDEHPTWTPIPMETRLRWLAKMGHCKVRTAVVCSTRLRTFGDWICVICCGKSGRSEWLHQGVYGLTVCLEYIVVEKVIAVNALSMVSLDWPCGFRLGVCLLFFCCFFLFDMCCAAAYKGFTPVSF